MRSDLVLLALLLTAATPVDALGQHIFPGDSWNAQLTMTDGEPYAPSTVEPPWASLQDAKRQATHWKRGAVIGAAAGFVIGAPIGYATFDQEAFDAGRQCGVLGCAEPLSRLEATVVGGVVGLSFGALLGAFIGRQIDVEVTPAATRAMNIRFAFPN